MKIRKVWFCFDNILAYLLPQWIENGDKSRTWAWLIFCIDFA